MAIEADVLVIGCGIAGAATALRLSADTQRQVVVLTRAEDALESNTRYAQGGIVSRGIDDSLESLVRDMLDATSGLAEPPGAVRLLAKEGPALVRKRLMDDAGVAFDRDTHGALAFGREGGHTIPRILHVGDMTGKAIMDGLLSLLRARTNVQLVTGATAVDLITSSHHSADPLAVYQPIRCHGAYVLDSLDGRVHRYLAKATVLAAGGIGRVYRHTTNPPGARGDGLAMASRSGARTINTEYVQFHPTTLALPGSNNALISEAVRGEGAKLLTPDGRHFMAQVAPKWADLAPRDVVSRAIHHEMVEHGYPHVLLDLASAMPKAQIPERFPTVHASCLAAGLDPTEEPIPVVPAAHYHCGGVQVDTYGRSTVQGLYAVGEVSCTGVHGANRLPSTSLLEGLLWGERAGAHIASREQSAALADAQPASADLPSWQPVSSAVHAEGADHVLVFRDQRTIQNIMWLYVGLARNTHRLKRALKDLNHLWEMIDDFYRSTRLSDELVGLRNTAQAAWIITSAAWHNRRSCGTHFREDGQSRTFASLDDTESRL
ncbi:MAG: FAD-dependent oxidoreductase [Deltaproteobacteria bacterium]|nr:FAD-dependent oxidoreductase [Deltaproteobacteria bacterium]